MASSERSLPVRPPRRWRRDRDRMAPGRHHALYRWQSRCVHAYISTVGYSIGSTKRLGANRRSIHRLTMVRIVTRRPSAQKAIGDDHTHSNDTPTSGRQISNPYRTRHASDIGDETPSRSMGTYSGCSFSPRVASRSAVTCSSSSCLSRCHPVASQVRGISSAHEANRAGRCSTRCHHEQDRVWALGAHPARKVDPPSVSRLRICLPKRRLVTRLGFGL
jgi:hypothetical protein